MAAAATTEEGFTEFNAGSAKRKVKGTLFRLNAAPSAQVSLAEKYVRDGAMQQDFMFVRTLYGMLNTGQRRDFGAFWESPWAEEHVFDSAKKRKVEEQNRSLALRSYIRSSTSQDPDDAEKYIDTVSKLMKWDGQRDARDVVKTVSSMVQAYEQVSFRTLLDHPLTQPGGVKKSPFGRAAMILKQLYTKGISTSVNSLRRDRFCYDAFAQLVASEILFKEATDGTKNTSIHLSKRLESERNNTIVTMLKILDRIEGGGVKVDTLGLPLMFMKQELCIKHGVLVVNGNDAAATYILNIEGLENGTLNLEGIEQIDIENVYTEEEDAAAAAGSGGGAASIPVVPEEPPPMAAKATAPKKATAAKGAVLGGGFLSFLGPN